MIKCNHIPAIKEGTFSGRGAQIPKFTQSISASAKCYTETQSRVREIQRGWMLSITCSKTYRNFPNKLCGSRRAFLIEGAASAKVLRQELSW